MRGHAAQSTVSFRSFATFLFSLLMQLPLISNAWTTTTASTSFITTTSSAARLLGLHKLKRRSDECMLQSQRWVTTRQPLQLGAHFHAVDGAAPSDDDQPALVRSRQPHRLANGRGAFLGFRNVKDVPGLSQQLHPHRRRASSSSSTSSSSLQSSLDALMPDGGLSPCVIRVLGVGGGGCNAVGDT